MRTRSSTSSSSSPVRRTARTLAWTTAFLVACRLVLLGLSPVVENLLDKQPRRETRTAAHYLASRAADDIRVIFMGSSRMKSGVDSDEWADLAGLPRSSVVNLAISNGTLEDVLTIFGEAGVPPSVEMVVVDVEPAFFNRNRTHPVTGKPDPADAEPVPPGPVKAVAFAVWPIHWRRSLKDWASGIEPAARSLEGFPRRPRYHTDPAFALRLAQSKADGAVNMGHAHLDHFSPSPRFGPRVRALSALLARKNLRLVFVHPPYRSGYPNALDGDPDGQAAYRQWKRDLRSFSGAAETLFWESAAECGLDDSVFLDFGHFTREGQRRFTRRLYAEIGERPSAGSGDVPPASRGSSLGAGREREAFHASPSPPQSDE